MVLEANMRETIAANLRNGALETPENSFADHSYCIELNPKHEPALSIYSNGLNCAINTL